MTTAQEKARRAPRTELAKAQTSLTMMENGLAALPAKWAREEAKKKADIEKQRQLVEELKAKELAE